MGDAFHAYPSVAQSVNFPPYPYSRATPLACDVLEFNTIPPSVGVFDLVNHCYRAVVPQLVEFHATVLFINPADQSQINVWLMKNVLPPPDGSTGGEMCGDDVCVRQLNSGGWNVTARTTRKMILNFNDQVWAVPGCPGGGNLANAVNGNNTCNYFEGHVLKLL